MIPRLNGGPDPAPRRRSREAATSRLRCLNVQQPWAQAIAVGSKRVESCSWTTSYRGLLAIHAGKRYDLNARGPWEMVDGPRGAVVAVCSLFDVHRAVEDDASSDSICCLPYGAAPPGAVWSYHYHWRFTDIRRLAVPIPARGYGGLWDASDELRREIEAQLGVLSRAAERTP